MKNVTLYIDLVFCLVVLPVMAIIFPMERWFHNFQWYIICVGIWLYTLYVVNRMATVPLLFGGPRARFGGICIIILSVMLTLALTRVDLYQPKPLLMDIGVPRIFPLVKPYKQAVWALFMIVEAFSFAVGLMVQTNLQKARRRKVEAERDKAEIELYRAQIKPHFMFNTLNSLYGLFLTRNEKALDSLEKFISMMRYMHTTSRCDYVALSDEADYIRQYVDLQSIRLNGKTTVSLDIEIEHPDMLVPPMLLVTFVENCFKHGVSPLEESRISISLHENKGELVFTTVNRIFPVKRDGDSQGIENCRKRLQLLYPDTHKLTTGSDADFFHVSLNIRLDYSQYKK